MLSLSFSFFTGSCLKLNVFPREHAVVPHCCSFPFPFFPKVTPPQLEWFTHSISHDERCVSFVSSVPSINVPSFFLSLGYPLIPFQNTVLYAQKKQPAELIKLGRVV